MRTTSLTTLPLPLVALVALLALALCAADEAPDASDARPRVTRDDLALDLVLSEPAIATPVAIDVDRSGRVWVIESNTHFQPKDYARHATDRVLVVTPAAGAEGGAATIAVFADGLEQTMALALGESRSGDALFLATRRDVRLLLDADRDGRADRTVFLARLETAGTYPHNGLSGFAFDGLGNVYFATGENLAVPYRLSGSDGASVVGGPDGGSIFRMRLDGGGLERWALGFWNTFHLACDPFGRLFAVDNDPDSRPPCRLLHIVRGGDYGYRRWLGRKGLHPFTSWDGELPGTLPMVSGTGEAPSGILWYASGSLPEGIHGKLLVTSWGDHRVSAYALAENGASFTSAPAPLVTGGEDFRPVGIATAPDGSVYFSDWVKKDYPVHGHGRLWRLRARTADGSVDASSAEAPPAVRRYRTLVSLARRGSLGDVLEPALADPSPEVRAAAVRLAVETGEIAAERLAALALAPPGATSGRDPGVCLEALTALARGDALLPDESVTALEELAIGADPFIAAAAVRVLARAVAPRALEERAQRLIDRGAPDDAARRLALLLALRARGDVRHRHLAGAFLADPDPAVRRAALQWVGEDRLFEHRAAIDRALSAGTPARAVLDAYLAARTLLAGESPEERDRVFRGDALGAVLRDRRAPAALRVLALRTVARRGARFDIDFLRELLASRDDGADSLRLDAIRALADAAVPGGAELLLAEAQRASNPLRLRREAIAGLSAYLPDARLAAELAGLAALDGSTTAQSAGTDGGALARESRRSLRLGGGLPDDDEPKAYDRDALLRASDGDPARGEILFFHPRGPRCGLCHTVAGRGGVAGPDLSRAALLGRERIVDSILTPSREVAPHFVTWVVVTPGGAVSGTLLREEADGALVLASTEGTTRRVPPGEVLEATTSPVSIMPEGLLDLLDTDEIAELLAYLDSLR